MTPLPKISAPAARALASHNVASLEQLSQYTRQEIAILHGVGPTVLRMLDAALAAAGLSWK